MQGLEGTWMYWGSSRPESNAITRDRHTWHAGRRSWLLGTPYKAPTHELKLACVKLASSPTCKLYMAGGPLPRHTNTGLMERAAVMAAVAQGQGKK